MLLPFWQGKGLVNVLMFIFLLINNAITVRLKNEIRYFILQIKNNKSRRWAFTRRVREIDFLR